MKKRRLELDREVVTTVASIAVDGALSFIMITSLDGMGGSSAELPTCTGCTCFATCYGGVCGPSEEEL